MLVVHVTMATIHNVLIFSRGDTLTKTLREVRVIIIYSHIQSNIEWTTSYNIINEFFFNLFSIITD